MTHREFAEALNKIDAAMNVIVLGLGGEAAERIRLAYVPLLDILEEEEYFIGMGEQTDREMA